MRREPDLIREIVLEIERAAIPADGIIIDDFAVDFEVDGYTPEQVQYHYERTYEYGYLCTGKQGKFDLYGLSNTGHDYADAVRDPKAWRLLKDGLLSGTDSAFELLTDLAKGYIRKRVESLTGAAF